MNRPTRAKCAPKFFDEVEASGPAMPQIRSVLGKKRARNKSLEPVVVESTPISQQPNFQQLLLDGLPSYTPAISVHLRCFSGVLSNMNPLQIFLWLLMKQVLQILVYETNMSRSGLGQPSS